MPLSQDERRAIAWKVLIDTEANDDTAYKLSTAGEKSGFSIGHAQIDLARNDKHYRNGLVDEVNRYAAGKRLSALSKKFVEGLALPQAVGSEKLIDPNDAALLDGFLRTPEGKRHVDRMTARHFEQLIQRLEPLARTKYGPEVFDDPDAFAGFVKILNQSGNIGTLTQYLNGEDTELGRLTPEELHAGGSPAWIKAYTGRYKSDLLREGVGKAMNGTVGKAFRSGTLPNPIDPEAQYLQRKGVDKTSSLPTPESGSPWAPFEPPGGSGSSPVDAPAVFAGQAPFPDWPAAARIDYTNGPLDDLSRRIVADLLRNPERRQEIKGEALRREQLGMAEALRRRDARRRSDAGLG